jgi:hypothetical protein
MREVKTHHVQLWLEGIAREHEISKTTLRHVKNLLSVFLRIGPCVVLYNAKYIVTSRWFVGIGSGVVS